MASAGQCELKTSCRICHDSLSLFSHSNVHCGSGSRGSTRRYRAGDDSRVPILKRCLRGEGINFHPFFLRFHAAINVDHFQVDRPFHRGTKDKENEFAVGETKRNFSHVVCTFLLDAMD